MNIFYITKEHEDKFVQKLTWVGRILLLGGFCFFISSLYVLFHPDMVIHFNGKPTTSINVKIGFVFFSLLHMAFSSLFAFLPRVLVGKVKKRLGVNNDHESEVNQTGR